MKKEKPKSTPVDANAPENPVELLVKAANYLAKEVTTLANLAHDGMECRSPQGQDVLMAELDRRLATYHARGLQALVLIVNDVVALHNLQVDELERLRKEKADELGTEDAHAGVGEGDVRREDQGVPPVGAGEAEVQGNADRGGAEEAPQGELRPEGEEQVRAGEVGDSEGE